jgi:hypothetical protein
VVCRHVSDKLRCAAGEERLRNTGMEPLTKIPQTLTKMAVFWIVAPCSLVEVYRRFIFIF